MFVDLVGHLAQHRDVAVIPKPPFDHWREFGGMVDLDLFGADHAPTALGLDGAHLGH